MSEKDLVHWLLQSSSPSIRFYTLRDLLDLPDSDPDVQSARYKIMDSGPVPDILSKQSAAGHWEGEHSYYTPKYTSTHWSMTLLVELGVDGDDPRFQRGIDFMLADTKERLGHQLEQQNYGFLCFWGNMLRYTLHGRRIDDTADLLALLDSEVFQQQWCCPYNAGLSCAWGVVRALWGLAAIPQSQRTPQVQSIIKDGLSFLLDSYTLTAANYPTPGKIHMLWHKLNFPMFYQADILFVLRVLAELDALHHPSAQAAVDWLCKRQQPNGHWRGSNPYKSRTWPVFGDAVESNRWVSLHAARIVKVAANKAA